MCFFVSRQFIVVSRKRKKKKWLGKERIGSIGERMAGRKKNSKTPSKTVYHMYFHVNCVQIKIFRNKILSNTNTNTPVGSVHEIMRNGSNYPPRQCFAKLLAINFFSVRSFYLLKKYDYNMGALPEL